MWLVFLLLGLAILLVVVLLCGLLVYIRNYWKYLGIPHDRPKPLRETLKGLFQDAPNDLHSEVKYLNSLYTKFKGSGPFCGFYHFLRPRALILDTELIKRILIKDFSNFNDRGEYFNLDSDPLSGNLYSICDNDWSDMRKRLSNYFNRESMRFIFENLVSESHFLQLAFEMNLQDQFAVSFDLYVYLDDFILKSLARNVFGLDEEMRKKYPLDQFGEMTRLALSTRKHGPIVTKLMRRYRKMFQQMRFNVTKSKVDKYFSQLLTDVVDYRQKMNISQDDFLDKLIFIMNDELNTHETNANDIKKHLMNELIAHAFTFLKSGYENTTQTLKYVLLELSLNKAEQDKVRSEIQQMLMKHGQQFNYDFIQDLKFLGKVISETLRLHPIHPFIVRRTLRSFNIPNYPNYTLFKDMYLVIPTHAIHNDPDLYPKPMDFLPERFNASDNQKRLHEAIWLGYSIGPRNCIGLHYSQVLIRAAVARILLSYDLTFDSSKLDKTHNPFQLPLYVSRLNHLNSNFRESIVI